MYLGIDLGTSGLKVVLVDDTDSVLAQASSPLEVSRPEPLWSEQNPDDWWAALNEALAQLKQTHGPQLAEVKAVGLSGQMHGAVLLDAKDAVLRPAILWNDGRSGGECAELEAAVPNARALTGNIAMPGFTAPKLLWVAKHERNIFDLVAKVLLPKDYLRLRMTGDYASDMSDSAGTLWLDVRGRCWSDEMLHATGLSQGNMPQLFEGTETTGVLRKEVAEAWGMGQVPVAGGGGDNAAGAAGVGVVRSGQAFLSLGTSGVYFVADAAYRPNPAGAVHTFCHCLPSTWHQMAVVLSAASCLTWVTNLTGANSEADLLAELEDAKLKPPTRDNEIFLPYLSGERTPHNNPHAKGVFFGMTHETDRPRLARAVLEGVAFAFADGQAALLDAGTHIEDVTVIGGGAQGDYWVQLLADVLGRPLLTRSGGEIGPAFGAARLARLAMTGESPEEVCVAPPVVRAFRPNVEFGESAQERYQLFRKLYVKLKDSFQNN